MTTEEIMRLNAPRNLGEWAFQGFPGRSKRIRQARELAGEGRDQRLAEEAAMQDIVKARAAEMLKLQMEARERQATLEHLQALRRGDFENAARLGEINRQAEINQPYRDAQIESMKAGAEAQRDTVETNRAFREAQASDANTRTWDAMARALDTNKKQSQTQYERAGEGLVEIDPKTGAKFYIGPDPTTGVMGRVPLQVPPIRVGDVGGGGSYLPPRADVSTMTNPQPVRAGDEQAPVAKPGFWGRIFGGGAKPAAPATVNSGWDGSQGYSEKAPVSVTEPVTREAALAEQPTVFANSYMPRFFGAAGSADPRRAMGGVQFVNPKSEEQLAAELYTANRQSMMPDAAYMRGTYMPGRSRRLDAALARPSRAFQYLQSLYQ